MASHSRSVLTAAQRAQLSRVPDDLPDRDIARYYTLTPADLAFIPSIVDRMISVTDAQSVAATRLISERLGRRVGGSTGTNLWACAQLIAEMIENGVDGSIVTLICDNGDRYLDTYFSDDWLAASGIDWRPEYEGLKQLTGS